MGTRIVKRVADWIRKLVIRPTRHADSPLHVKCQKFLQKLHDAPYQELKHSVLLKRMKTDAKSFSAITEMLKKRGDIEVITTPRAGHAKRSYRLTKGGFNDAGRTV